MARKPKPPVLDFNYDWEMRLYEIIEDTGVAQMILEINQDIDDEYQRDKYYQRNYNTIAGLLAEHGEFGSRWDENIPKGELLLVKGHQGFAVLYVNPQQEEGIEAAYLGWDSIVDEGVRRKKRITVLKDGRPIFGNVQPTPEQWPLWSGWALINTHTHDVEELEGFRYMVIPDVFDNSPQLGVLNWWW